MSWSLNGVKYFSLDEYFQVYNRRFYDVLLHVLEMYFKTFKKYINY